MGSVNSVLNRINEWQQPINLETNEEQGWFKRNVASRLATVVFGSLLDANEMVKESFTLACVAPKAAIRKINLIAKSDRLDSADRALPSTNSIFSTAYRVVACAIGIFSSIVLGSISPSLNYKFHSFLGLAKGKADDDVCSLIKEAQYERMCNLLNEACDDLANAPVTDVAESDKVVVAEATKEGNSELVNVNVEEVVVAEIADQQPSAEVPVAIAPSVEKTFVDENETESTDSDSEVVDNAGTASAELEMAGREAAKKIENDPESSTSVEAPVLKNRVALEDASSSSKSYFSCFNRLSNRLSGWFKKA